MKSVKKKNGMQQSAEVNNYIPRTIHYIWLSDEPLNACAQKCIESWQLRAEGYVIKHWSMKDFDFSTMPLWVNQALEKKKWAFVCDYLRLYVLEQEGGFYLDSDVFMLRSPEEFRKYRFVSAVEYSPVRFEAVGKYQVDADGNALCENVDGMAIQAAIMGSEPHHPYLRRVMEFYETHPFILEDGSLYMDILAPQIYANFAVELGFKYRDVRQELADGVVLLESYVFTTFGCFATRHSAMVHLGNGSWMDLDQDFRNEVQDRNAYYIENALMRCGDIPTILRVIPKRIVRKLIRIAKKVTGSGKNK